MQEMYQHQKDFLAKRASRTALVWSCGTGKTRTACEWSKQSDTPCLIVCPKSLKKNWRRECKKWGAQMEVMTKEEFRKTAIAGKVPWYGQVVVDEVHNGFLTPNFKSQMSKALRDYIRKNKTERVLLLSATVYTSSPWNIFTLATLLGYNWNWREFSWKYFYHVQMGFRMVPMPKKGVEVEMARLTKQIASVVDIHECMDVPLQQHLDPEYFALTKDQERGIEAAYNPVHIVRYTKQHEIENGILIGDKEGLVPNRTFECDKDSRIMDLIKENKKIAIVCRYNLQIDNLHSIIKAQMKDKLVYMIRGATKNRDEITRAAEIADDCVVLIQADCAEGYQLPSFELCVFASMSYSYAKFEQVCGRFLRMDKPSRTTFMFLLSGEDSIDQAVYDSVKRKENFQIELYGVHRT